MIGVYGGTFDPVHYGHIRPAIAVKQALGLRELRFIPNREPPHRGKPWLSAEQRLALLHTAVDGLEGVVVDEREMQRDGPSYMIDTLVSLDEESGGECLCLIIGMDAFIGIDRWHQWQRLFEHVLLVVTQRPGFDIEDVMQRFSPSTAAFIRPRLLDQVTVPGSDVPECDLVGKILIQSVPQVDISSTQIREWLETPGEADAAHVRQWMPADVVDQLKRFMHDSSPG